MGGISQLMPRVASRRHTYNLPFFSFTIQRASVNIPYWTLGNGLRRYQPSYGRFIKYTDRYIALWFIRILVSFDLSLISLSS
jgi:hypothetical protein